MCYHGFSHSFFILHIFTAYGASNSILSLWIRFTRFFAQQLPAFLISYLTMIVSIDLRSEDILAMKKLHDVHIKRFENLAGSGKRTAAEIPLPRLEVLILLLRDSSFLRNLTLGKTVNNAPLV